MLTDMIRKALLAGVGIQEKFNVYLDDLVKKGELSQTQAAKFVKEWTSIAEKSTGEVSKSINEMVEKAMRKMNLPTADDIERLNRKVQSLSVRVKRLETKAGELSERTAELAEEKEA
ncbi:MAG: phasin family protein [Nitrospiraceae bacterium]|nr:phasin family protein [Nitrospiraceae bacterium]